MRGGGEHQSKMAGKGGGARPQTQQLLPYCVKALPGGNRKETCKGGREKEGGE